MQVRVSRWGNSLAVRLPKHIAEELRLEEGQTVDLTVDMDELKLRPVTPIPRYRLEDLIAQMDPANQPELVDWGPDVGAEIIDDDYSKGSSNAE
jgi:antitoxin MazE